MNTYRVLITGSRDWRGIQAVRAALDEMLATRPADHQLVVVHGDCPTGADAMAKAWARTTYTPACTDDIEYVTEEPHPANWRRHGHAAGPIRNAHMIQLGANACLAFIGPCTSPRCHKPGPHPSHGATGCALLAEQAGIPVRRITA
ncbi:SLOG family protein [Streptomyces albidoflavus]